MKKTLIVVLIAFLAMSGSAMAQKTVKLGHISSADLMQIMPGKDSVQTVLQNEVAELENNLKALEAELQQRYNEYQEKQAGWSDLIKQTKQRELQDMQARAQEFQAGAQEQLQKRQQELLQPIIDKAKKAIEDVAKEGGYTYVFDSSNGTLLYQQDSDDLLPLVKKKLGLK
ncbi:MAG: OmpH family outer membrane protein [Bacteroidales bacterium]|nr:OmpH family outer membrane protein [Bacteroidales bacterium]